MARQTAPKFLGVLKRDKNAPQGFYTEVWQLDSGALRHVVKKGSQTARNGKQGTLDGQMRLVDVDGNPI